MYLYQVLYFYLEKKYDNLFFKNFILKGSCLSVAETEDDVCDKTENIGNKISLQFKRFSSKANTTIKGESDRVQVYDPL
jgi:hypothetical protein